MRTVLFAALPLILITACGVETEEEARAWDEASLDARERQATAPYRDFYVSNNECDSLKNQMLATQQEISNLQGRQADAGCTDTVITGGTLDANCLNMMAREADLWRKLGSLADQYDELCSVRMWQF